jgi:hypothetical protein
MKNFERTQVLFSCDRIGLQSQPRRSVKIRRGIVTLDIDCRRTGKLQGSTLESKALRLPRF